MLILQDVEVHSHLAVWCGGFINYVSNGIVFMIGCTIAQLEDRKILVFEVYAQCGFVLPIVAYGQLYRSDSIYHDL